MKHNKGWAALLVAVLLTSCAGKPVEMPSPQELVGEIGQKVDLPEMVDLAEEMLLDSTGIAGESYNSVVCLLLAEGMGPDEIIIVEAVDSEAADEIREKLETRLEYKKKAAQSYLTEYMPVLRDGVVRRDGLTVSLIVSEQAEKIAQIYDQYT